MPDDIVLRNVPAELRARYASLADDAGTSVPEYIARVLVQHLRIPDVSDVEVPARPFPNDFERERQIVRCALEGWTTREIGQALHLTNEQVNTIRRRNGVGAKQIGGPRAR